MKKPRIVIDQNIPFIKGRLEKYFDTVYFHAKDITSRVVANADGLMIRSVCKANKGLLNNSSVKIITSATIGDDHIDKDFCQRKNIQWFNAKGCNAEAVHQYILTAFFSLMMGQLNAFEQKTIGIIGVGNIGSKVARSMEKLGLRVLLNDPPRARNENRLAFVELRQLLEEADVISFHVPLVASGEDKTIHMADEAFFKMLKKPVILMNTSRGKVIKTKALVDAIQQHKVSSAVIDVWENEPKINPALLSLAQIATPHIAGYSLRGKMNAANICMVNLCRFFGFDPSLVQDVPPPKKEKYFIADRADSIENLAALIASVYDISKDTRKLKTDPHNFSILRDQYPLRTEYSDVCYDCSMDCAKSDKLIDSFGFCHC